MATICVNRSGKSWKVTKTNGGTDYIGTIKSNQVFVWTGSWNGNEGGGADYQGVYFNGGHGWVDGGSGTGLFTSLTNCGLYKVDIDGKSQAVFQTRRSSPYYNSKGEYLGNIPAGWYVSTKDASAGKENPKLMHIDTYGEGDPTGRNAFIDTGLNKYPDFSNFNLIGKL